MHGARWLGLLAGIFCGLVSSQAWAQSGLYVSATGGALFPEPWGSDAAKANLKTGYSVLGAVGVSIGIVGLRIEAEGGYRQSDIQSTTIAGVSTPTSGHAKIATGMVNAYFEIPYTILHLRPYIGAGVGAARVESNNSTAAGDFVLGGNETVLAYQAMAGLAYSMNSHLTWTLGYRYFATDTVRLVETAAGATSSLRQGGIRTNSAELGLRLTF